MTPLGIEVVVRFEGNGVLFADSVRWLRDGHGQRDGHLPRLHELGVRPKLDPTYLMWALIMSRQRLLALSSGSTHRTIYMRVVEQFRVLLPHLIAARIRPSSDGGGDAEDGAARVAGGAGRALRHAPAPRLSR